MEGYQRGHFISLQQSQERGRSPQRGGGAIIMGWIWGASSDASSDLGAEAHVSARHLLHVVLVEALALGHGEMVLPVSNGAWGRARRGSAEARGDNVPGAPWGRSPLRMKGETLWSMKWEGTML